MATVKVKLEDLPPLTSAQNAELRRLARRPDSEIDFSDIPELDEAWFARARAAAAAAKVPPPRKQPIALRLDSDVLTWFRAQGKGYQTQINAVLREFMRSAPKPKS